MGEPRQPAGGVPESAVDRFDVTHAGNAAVADPKNADVVSALSDPLINQQTITQQQLLSPR